MSRRDLVTLIVALTLPFAALVVFGFVWQFGGDSRQPYRELRESIDQRRYEQALQTSREVLTAEPRSLRAAAFAAIAATGLHDRQSIETYCDAIVDGEFDAEESSAAELLELSSRLTDEGLLATAEAILRYTVGKFPSNDFARISLARILAMSARRHEAREQLLPALRHTTIDLRDLVKVTDDSTVFSDDSRALLRTSVSHDSDPVAMLGLAWNEHQSGNNQAAELEARGAIEIDPNLVAAHAVVGSVLLARGDEEGLRRWNAGLPPEADSNDEIWAIRGVWYRDQGEYEAAARCFWECVVRNPDHRLANAELGKVLPTVRQLDAQPFVRRGESLRRLWLEVRKLRLDELEQSPSVLGIAPSISSATQNRLRKIVDLLEALRRFDEALAWVHATQRIATEAGWVASYEARLTQNVRDARSGELNPGEMLDLSHLSLPKTSAISTAGDARKDVQGACQVRFVDDAKRVGLDFTYFNSPDPTTEGMRMFEWTGGGIGVLDFDLDGWPDAYLAQGCPMMPKQERHAFRDALFRGIDGKNFTDVAELAGLGDRDFSQGCAIGDFDNDGFPDVYVCNIGMNRLYRNNGDGTFAEVTRRIGCLDDAWTVSSAICDLDGDGNPEIYDVNYITGEGVFTAMCQHHGVARACQPTEFVAAQDRLLLSRGDGSFDDVTSTSGIVVPEGVGLGIVAGDFSGRGGIDLFIANDGFPNFHFVHQTPGDRGRLQLTESAVLTGVGFDARGIPQACMGVAAGDANQDGLLDLFVTNYYEESNVLYQQTSAAFFVDASRQAGLVAPSFSRLGFGTQFIDGELDGLPDLIVTNGDIDDFSASGRPYRQTAQYLQNVGRGRFVEIDSATLGPFFAVASLGRALARLDWNRDGREDCLISHLDSPVALLTNETTPHGHFLAVRLRGTASARDAIGTTVTLTCGGSTWMQQLTAGDGYMASNERQLVFGIGENQRIDELTIRWPAGGQQRFESISADRELLFIEGKGEFWTVAK